MKLYERFEEAWADVTARANVVVQDKNELFALIALMTAREVTSYLELGASEGVSLYCIGMCLPDHAEIAAVDLCEAHSRGNLFENADLLRAAGRKVTVYEGTTLQAVTTLKEKRWDALLIDAGHSYLDVKQDWINYNDAADMVVFHDIRLIGPGQLWGEIGGGLEIHGDRKKPMGFGVKYNG